MEVELLERRTSKLLEEFESRRKELDDLKTAAVRLQSILSNYGIDSIAPKGQCLKIIKPIKEKALNLCGEAKDLRSKMYNRLKENEAIHIDTRRELRLELSSRIERLNTLIKTLNNLLVEISAMEEECV